MGRVGNLLAAVHGPAATVRGVRAAMAVCRRARRARALGDMRNASAMSRTPGSIAGAVERRFFALGTRLNEKAEQRTWADTDEGIPA
jgi:hypothetical protein